MSRQTSEHEPIKLEDCVNLYTDGESMGCHVIFSINLKMSRDEFMEYASGFRHNVRESDVALSIMKRKLMHVDFIETMKNNAEQKYKQLRKEILEIDNFQDLRQLWKALEEDKNAKDS